MTETFTRLKQNLDQAAAKAKQVADDARKASALSRCGSSCRCSWVRSWRASPRRSAGGCGIHRFSLTPNYGGNHAFHSLVGSRHSDSHHHPDRADHVTEQYATFPLERSSPALPAATAPRRRDRSPSIRPSSASAQCAAGRQLPPVAERLREAGRDAVDGCAVRLHESQCAVVEYSRCECRLRARRDDGSGRARRGWTVSFRRRWPSARRDAHRCSECSRSRESGSPCRGH